MNEKIIQITIPAILILALIVAICVVIKDGRERDINKAAIEKGLVQKVEHGSFLRGGDKVIWVRP
jgi:hypothetical protein